MKKEDNNEKKDVKTDKEKNDIDEKVIDQIDEKDELIKSLQSELDDLKNKYALAYADTQNMQKRLQQEANQANKYRIQTFALDILPILDNLERALKGECKDENFHKGIEMIYNELINSLKKEGVEEVDCLNKEFDPNYQQAIVQEEKEGTKPNIVIEVLQKGYILKDRVLRPAMVKVSK